MKIQEDYEDAEAYNTQNINKLNCKSSDDTNMMSLYRNSCIPVMRNNLHRGKVQNS